MSMALKYLQGQRIFVQHSLSAETQRLLVVNFWAVLVCFGSPKPVQVAFGCLNGGYLVLICSQA